MSRFMDQANELTAGLPEDHPAFRFVEHVRQYEELVGDLPKHMALPQIAVLERIIARPFTTAIQPPSVTLQQAGDYETDTAGWTEADTDVISHDGGSWEQVFADNWHSTNQEGQIAMLIEHLDGSFSNLNEVVGSIPELVVYRSLARLLVRYMSAQTDVHGNIDRRGSVAGDFPSGNPR